MNFDRLKRKLERLDNVSKDGKVIRDVFNTLVIPELWYLAYANIYSNKGTITKGIDDITLDGISEEYINNIIAKVKNESYRPKPVRRAYIPKKDGSKRPLGIPSGDDKLVQMAIKIVLECIYEPTFSKFSHGFRPDKSCHTALKSVQRYWTGVKWFIEFDIKGFFDNVNHKTLIELLKKKIDDKRFIKLIRLFLKAGYMEDYQPNRTYSGTPQGGIISPLLSNIYLHELDVFMEKSINDFNRGHKRPTNPEHRELSRKIAYRRRKIRTQNLSHEVVDRIKTEIKEIQKELHKIPSGIENTDEYLRLRYCRYADDFICGVTGSFKQATTIMQSVETYISDNLHLSLSPEKSRIRRARKGIEFLGYGIQTQTSETKTKKVKINNSYTTKRTISSSIRLSIPKDSIKDFAKEHGYGKWGTKEPLHRPHLLTSSEVEIISTYNAELKGFCNYYSLARDMKSKLFTLAYLANYSLFKTLASKLKTTTSKVRQMMKNPQGYVWRYRIRDEAKQILVFQPKHHVTPTSCQDTLPLTIHYFGRGSELIRRLSADECEICGRVDRPVEVHHVNKLKNLKSKTSLEWWEKIMIAKNRKTLIVCAGDEGCHNLIHTGTLPDMRHITPNS